MMTRRDALKTTVLVTGGLIALPAAHSFAQSAAPTGPFKLPPLPYAFDALEPHIDARTMEIHHGKHHSSYITNLNKAVAEAPELRNMQIGDIVRALDKVPENMRVTVRNNAGGAYNHDRFWKMLKPRGGGQPKAELAKSIEKSFGSFSSFQDKFTEAATKVFGSGWAWLVRSPEGKLDIVSTPNQDSPIMRDLQNKPLLALDVWEHAYYLKYQNRRADYIKAWWNVVNWDYVTERLLGK